MWTLNVEQIMRLVGWPNNNHKRSSLLKVSKSSGASVRCNCVNHAILSAPDTFAHAIVTGAMQKPAGVRCNCVSHAILSAPDTFSHAIVSGAMQKPSSGHVHDCTCMCAGNKRACTEPTFAAWIFTYYDYGRTFPMSFMTGTYSL